MDQITEQGNSRLLISRDLNFRNLGAATLESGLQTNEIVALQKNAAGFCSFEYLLRHRELFLPEERVGGYSLGVASYKDHTEPFAAAINLLQLDHFYKAHEDFGIDMNDKNHIDIFMRKLVATGRPIVFFVPPNVYHHKGHIPVNFVAQEMQWDLDKPGKRARTTTFCFGLYDVLRNEDYSRLPRGYKNEGVEFLTKLFSEIK